MIQATPSRTALRVALRRAAHQLVNTPPLVFPDPFAIPILGPEAAVELQRTPSAHRKPHSAALRAWVVARARFAEDTLATAVANRAAAIGEAADRTTANGKAATQYLILGAGLDTFALRNPFPHLRIFEVDHPATQAWKRDRLRAANLALPASVTLVPVDFEQQSLHRQLLQVGFDFCLPTVTAWLGVVPYLTPEAFAATCRVLGGLPAGSDLVFDYSQPREVLPPVEQLMHDSLAARVAQAGEPFQLFFTPTQLAAALRNHGLQTVEDLGSRELATRYFAHRTDGLGLHGTAGRLCHATVIRCAS